MIAKMPTHCGDDTCSACVVAGDYIFLAHHGGGQEVEDIAHQMRATLDDIVQLNFYIRNVSDFRRGADVFREYFLNGAPARTTVVTDFVGPGCLCQMDGIAYKPQRER